MCPFLMCGPLSASKMVRSLVVYNVPFVKVFQWCHFTGYSAKRIILGFPDPKGEDLHPQLRSIHCMHVCVLAERGRFNGFSYAMRKPVDFCSLLRACIASGQQVPNNAE